MTMAYKKSLENPKQNSQIQTRKTMLFNERTDRSLNAELSQLELCRKEVKRDLRKIHQIREALNESLLSTMNRSRRNRSVSDTNLKNSNMFPRIPTANNQRKHYERRKRFNSDPPSYMTYNDAQLTTEKVQSPDSNDNFNLSDTGLDMGNKGLENLPQYVTNQQRRENLMIKSRFNQLGSKFVGVEMIAKRKLSNGRVPDRNGYNDVSSGKKTRRKTSNEKSNESSNETNVDEITEKDLSKDFANMNVSSSETSASKNQVESKDRNLVSFPVFEEPLKTLSNKEIFNRDRQPLENQTNSSSTLTGGGAVQRKISTGSMSGFDHDASRQRAEVPLPRIPLELTSSRLSKNGSIVEQAFITCQQLNSNNKDEKQERKRRFANLVNAVIKQGKVIKAWEPLLSKFGDIHSSDEESP